MNLFDIVVAKALAGSSGGGGGGSSDFSTAEVTVIVNNPQIFEGDPSISIRTLFEFGDAEYSTTEEGLLLDANNKATILLYDGSATYLGAIAYDDNNEYRGSVSATSGNISQVGLRWVITGDCTITIGFSVLAEQ